MRWRASEWTRQNRLNSGEKCSRKWKIEFYLRRKVRRIWALSTHCNVDVKKPIGYIHSYSVHNAHYVTNFVVFEKREKEKEKDKAKTFNVKTDFFSSIHLLFLCVCAFVFSSFFFPSSLYVDSNAAPMDTSIFNARSFLFPFGKQSHTVKQKPAIMCLFRPFFGWYASNTHTETPAKQ